MDAIALLKQDHRKVEDLFRRYESLGEGETKQRTEVVNGFIRELSIHAAIEEQILYPEVKDVLIGGQALADEALHEHQEAKEALAEIDGMETTDPGFDAKVRVLIADVRHHVEEEENEMLPQLASAVPATKLAELGEQMENAKALAPTRPHPHAPSTPPGNVIAGPVAAVVDRVRDTIAGRGESKRSTSSGKRASQRKTTTTRVGSSTRGRSQRSAKSSSKRKTTTTKRSKASTATTTRQRRASEPVFHVISDDKGGWRAEREGSNRAVARGDDKRSVVKRARDLARSRGGRLVVHKKNGRIQEQRRYAA